MEKQKVGVDVDEVLFPFLDEFIKHQKEIYEIDLKPEQFLTYDFHDPLGLTIDESVDRIYSFLRTLAKTEIQPLEESRSAVQKMTNKYELDIITSRHSQFEVITVDWLEENYPSYFKDVFMIGYAPIMEKPRTKAEICLEIGAKALIDDSLPNSVDVARVGLDGVLFGSYPWNQALELPKGVTRCLNWSMVLEHFEID